MSTQFIVTVEKKKKAVRITFGYPANAQDFAERAKKVGYKTKVDLVPCDGRKKKFIKRTVKELIQAILIFKEVTDATSTDSW